MLSADKTLLDSLKAEIEELKGSGTDDNAAQTAANAFKTTHAGALGKTVAAVTTGDETAVNAALTAYDALGTDAKALLSAEKTLLDSLKTKIDQLKGSGTSEGKFIFTVWTDHDDEDLLSDIPGDTTILKSEQGSLTITAADLTNIQWSLNGVNIPAPRGTAQTITIEAASYVPGIYTLGLYAIKTENGVPVPYSINIPFVVDN